MLRMVSWEVTVKEWEKKLSFKVFKFVRCSPQLETNFLGLICAEGEIWKDQRKLSIKMLKEMGMVKFGEKRSDFEFRILKWVQECVKVR